MKKQKPLRRAANWTKEILPLLPDDCQYKMRNILSDPKLTDHHKSQFCFEAIIQHSDHAVSIFKQWFESKKKEGQGANPRRWTEKKMPPEFLALMADQLIYPEHPDAPKELVLFLCECSHILGWRTGCGGALDLENSHIHTCEDDRTETRGRCPNCHIRHDIPTMVPVDTIQEAHYTFPPEGVLLEFCGHHLYFSQDEMLLFDYDHPTEKRCLHTIMVSMALERRQLQGEAKQEAEKIRKAQENFDTAQGL